NETACRDFLDWFDHADRLRGSLARLIHAAADDIAFVPSAAHALSMIVAGLGLSDVGDGARSEHLFAAFGNCMSL
ncbi:MAG: hypothetical protein ACLP2X_26675, partial [Syntrophobacteraceae bacterium]